MEVLVEVVVGTNTGADADSVGGVSDFAGGADFGVVVVALADATILFQSMSIVANRSR